MFVANFQNSARFFHQILMKRAIKFSPIIIPHTLHVLSIGLKRYQYNWKGIQHRKGRWRNRVSFYPTHERNAAHSTITHKYRACVVENVQLLHEKHTIRRKKNIWYINSLIPTLALSNARRMRSHGIGPLMKALLLVLGYHSSVCVWYLSKRSSLKFVLFMTGYFLMHHTMLRSRASYS